MDVELNERGPYDKIEMSLRSGLPNEVDFALNVCILMSTEGKYVMRLHDTQHMLRLLMAHVGIFESASCDLQDLYFGWTKYSERNYLRVCSHLYMKFIGLFLDHKLKELLNL